MFQRPFARRLGLLVMIALVGCGPTVRNQGERRGAVRSGRGRRLLHGPGRAPRGRAVQAGHAHVRRDRHLGPPASTRSCRPRSCAATASTTTATARSTRTRIAMAMASRPAAATAATRPSAASPRWSTRARSMRRATSSTTTATASSTTPQLLCDQGLAIGSQNAMDYAKAIDLCQTATMTEKKWGVISATLTLADGTGAPASIAHVDPPAVRHGRAAAGRRQPWRC